MNTISHYNFSNLSTATCLSLVSRLIYLSLTLCVFGCSRNSGQADAKVDKTNAATPVIPSEPVIRNQQQRLGTMFSEYDGSQPASLKIRWIDLPDFEGTYAVWGGTGRDDAGNILLGVSTTWTPEAPQPSARLFRYSPADTGKLELVGDIVGTLKNLGINREAHLPLDAVGRVLDAGSDGPTTLCKESQMKIHSKLVAMDDGWTYFASMDEWNENGDGSQLPYWGSHLWRCRSEDNRWEHLASVPEALIAVSGVGRYLFALGYYGHVVYCYDTATQSMIQHEVGSWRGHISRNIAATAQGHVFVPRVVDGGPNDKADASPKVQLVELDHKLEELGATPLEHYSATPNASSHGLTGVANLADETVAFTTADGFLYQIAPTGESAANVQAVDWFNPAGKAYCASLFCIDGQRYLCGVTSRKGYAGFEWVTYDLQTNTSQAQPFEIPNVPDHGMKRIFLCGSNTRDDRGNFYVVGCYRTVKGNRQLPLCLQVSIE